ncbi:MAG: hypothetical protein M3164_05460 [Actinomycetota bacterium]|nr:hypothetical protein [Actinomycetota bacterium]
MKRGMAGRGRAGAPPLPRQRAALRVVQVTLVALGLFLAWLAARSWEDATSGLVGFGQVVVTAGAALFSLGAALWMGLRTVRGPEPPSLE